MKATCRATSNIAFVKYWGRLDEVLRLPLNGSISMNLASAYSTTTVEFDAELPADRIEATSMALNEKQVARIFQHVNRIRKIAGITIRVRIATQNNFPTGAGIASSASGFAALTVATAAAANLHLSERELSILARQGSGSACRSIPAGFVEWHEGGMDETSFAEQIAPPEHWDLRDLIAITETGHKTVGSADGNKLVTTSPFNELRVHLARHSLSTTRRAIWDRDWTLLGEEMEREAVRLHVVAMTSRPPIFYWNPVTVRIIQAVMAWRREGLEIYFTIDAGANVHVIAQGGRDADLAYARLEGLQGVSRVIHSSVGSGAQLIDEHLF